jgi:hypothetical protein
MTDSMGDDEWAKVRDEDLIDLTESYIQTSTPGAKANHTARAQMFMEQRLFNLVKNIYGIAMDSPNDRTRLQASQYLVDRVLGRIPLTGFGDGGKTGAPWEEVYEATIVHEPQMRNKEIGS